MSTFVVVNDQFEEQDHIVAIFAEYEEAYQFVSTLPQSFERYYISAPLSSIIDVSYDV